VSQEVRGSIEYSKELTYKNATVCVLSMSIGYFEELTYKNATGLCPQFVRESIKYFEELTYRNATGLCPQQVRESIEYFEELLTKMRWVCVLRKYVNGPLNISSN
jgi:hypothetical protein